MHHDDAPLDATAATATGLAPDGTVARQGDTHELTLRTQAMPADTNPAGDIFGGWVMAQMDIAAGIRGREVSGGRVVTAGVGELSFERPIHVGDTVCVYTEVRKVGRTSMTFDVDCFVRRQFTAIRERAVKAVFVMVALDEQGKPRPVMPDGGL